MNSVLSYPIIELINNSSSACAEGFRTGERIKLNLSGEHGGFHSLTFPLNKRVNLTEKPETFKFIEM